MLNGKTKNIDDNHKDLFRVKLALIIIIDIIELGATGGFAKKRQSDVWYAPLESLDIELKTPVSGVVRDHPGERISIRIVVGV